MSSQTPASPVVFSTPTLGNPVCLGELYDVRTGKFLGVQLYPQDKVKEIVTDIKHTELTVSLSTTTHQKATLLDINAQLSLDVLGGLIKVSGSASYLKDEKSNTNEQAYALALKMRLKEKRIPFAEVELGRNILPIVEKDYINAKLATHFVSSIVYGGNYIVNLVARQTEMTKEEKIEGKLQATFDKLKGAISLEGSVEAKIKGEFKDMDDKFDLVVHGDVALTKVPITPKDVLETFPEAATLLSSGGGVPISVTLQPIPADLYKGGLIYKIDDGLVDTVLTAFEGLDDIRSRFLVLQDSAKRLQDFIPELARTSRVVTTAYIKEHSNLLHRLAGFLQAHKLRVGPDEKKPDHAPLLADVNTLYLKNLELDDPNTKVSDWYPSTLAGLESELSRFQYLITDIRTVKSSRGAPSDQKTAFCLSTIDDIKRAVRTRSETFLFIMTPVYGNNTNHDPTILEYLAIVRKHAAYFEQSNNGAHLFYAENLDNLERRLSHDGKFAALKRPAVFIARVDVDGKLTWNAPTVPSCTYVVNHNTISNKIGRLTLGVGGVNTKDAFTIHIRAYESSFSDPKQDWAPILQLADTRNWTFLSFRKGFGVEYHKRQIRSREGKKPEPGKEFKAAFVQDILNHQWILYLNGDEIARESFADSELDHPGTEARILYQDGYWWNGTVYEFKGFGSALTKEEVRGLL